MLKKATVMRILYGPTAYALVGSLTALRSERRKCNATTIAMKQTMPKLATVAFHVAVLVACRRGERIVVAILFLLSSRLSGV